jgi:hypothetical protein
MRKLLLAIALFSALTSIVSAKEDWCKPRGEASKLAARMWHLMGRIEVGECQYVDAYIDAMKAQHKAADLSVATCKGVYIEKEADTSDFETVRKELKEACEEVNK